MLKKPFLFSHNNLLRNELDKSSVCANESEHNPQQASLKTLAGDHARKPQFSGCVRSYSVRTNVLPEYSLPHPRKLPVFRNAPTI